MTENKIMYEGAGIYQIENTDTGKIYIGSSVNIAKRIGEHLNALKGHYHDNKPMQEDFDKGARFYTTVLKQMTIDFLQELRLEELRAIDGAKRTKAVLYNTAEIHYPYRSKQRLTEILADKYCKEHFGVSLGNFLNKCPAAIDMWTCILGHPEKEAEIKSKYKAVISYQNQQANHKNNRHRKQATN